VRLAGDESPLLSDSQPFVEDLYAAAFRYSPRLSGRA
jgi:hypothetical protein